MKSFQFWTPDKFKAAYPTRKKRRKFFKRYLKQHGRPFRWFMEVKVFATLERPELNEIYLHRREAGQG